jgi:hypothetical protein
MSIPDGCACPLRHISRYSPRCSFSVLTGCALGTFPGLPATRLFGILRYDFGATMICPHCRSDNCFRSHRDGILDYAFSATGLRPWRCHSCDRRFPAWRVAANLERFAHCPRCGNFDIEHISRDRVEDGTLIFLKRWLRFPAYRCDPCRHRFFSVREFRRILPAMVESHTHRTANY